MPPDTLSPAAPQASPGDGTHVSSEGDGGKPGGAASGPARSALKRLVSLDAFRGLAVLGMLLVNNKTLGPWTPAQLTHGPHPRPSGPRLR